MERSEGTADGSMIVVERETWYFTCDLATSFSIGLSLTRAR
ncbi:hypothetical protein Esi_0071_0014 [Ectocarpus siliculosus]|uniref:Uncharacterized protein n=1 Tax=Ectocarpus siliculosus TaxID=2880 RepID=D7G611_ECTSI|nr:hypothetical protein Esi_0071_0014 [Ectocarpus siliculosus]|eukprot:CBJ27420.1 hypothetical protein Esi_0071_0014 [Ectocarpus siliculosus]